MTRTGILAKYGAYGAAISACMIALSYLTTVWMTEFDVLGSLRRSSRIYTVQNILERLPPDRRAEELKTLTEQEVWKGFRSIYLLSESGDILYPPGAKDLSRNRPPDPALSVEDLSEKTMRDVPRVWVDLKGEPRQHLLVERTPVDAMLFGRRLTVTFAILSLSLFAGVMASILVFLYFLRDRARTALGVISRLKGGDLKARLPVSRMDEFSHIAVLFNQMADEIESLVSSLREAERSRSSLMQELAHDLRTPVSGLKSVLETLRDRADRLTPEQTNELVSLAECEVDYFGSLVEDLLLLGSLDDPAYQEETVNLADLLRRETGSFAQRFADREIDLTLEGPLDRVTGNFRLLRRAVRNALENACVHARRRIEVRAISAKGEVRITVDDDGPGFTEAELKQFGTKRATRLVSQKGGKRISVGLGSVIMKSIAARHRGEVRPGNRAGEGGRILGASVEIRLPGEGGHR